MAAGSAFRSLGHGACRMRPRSSVATTRSSTPAVEYGGRRSTRTSASAGCSEVFLPPALRACSRPLKGSVDPGRAEIAGCAVARVADARLPHAAEAHRRELANLDADIIAVESHDVAARDFGADDELDRRWLLSPLPVPFLDSDTWSFGIERG